MSGRQKTGDRTWELLKYGKKSGNTSKRTQKKKKIFIDCVNGYIDHCHCLISLGFDQTIMKIMQLLKGESAYWINKQKLCNNKFEWQDEYYAVSVSESDIIKVRRYIQNQEEHHKQKSLQDELKDLLEKWGFHRFKDGSQGQQP